MLPTPLYFDYAATTPVDKRVIEAMMACLGRHAHFGNPASTGHAHGQAARALVDQARMQVARCVGAEAQDIIWTSGATESNNLALKGIVQGAGERRHIITSVLEHKAVLDTVAELESQGHSVTYLKPDTNGLIQPLAVQQALRPETALVSLMAVNNELGTLTDIATIGTLVREHGALFHVDAAQAIGKLAIDLQRMAIDLMSFSAHKVYGPKGIGALYVGARARLGLRAQMHGGGHEGGLRSGTLATHQIVGMGSAFALASRPGDAEHQRIERLAGRLLDGLLGMPGVSLNGCAVERIAHTLNLRIDSFGFNSATLAGELALSSTSACNSAANTPSHVLLALGLNESQARNSVRVSLGRYTTEAEVDTALEVFARALGSASATPW